MKINYVLLLLILINYFFSINGIQIISYHPESIVYAGPNGVIDKQFKSQTNPYLYNEFESVANFYIRMNEPYDYEFYESSEVIAPIIAKVVKGEEVVIPVIMFNTDGFTLNSFDQLESPQDVDFDIYFDCQKDGTAIIEFLFETSLVRESMDPINETFSFFVSKKCKLSRRAGFTVQHKYDYVIRRGIVQSRWSVESEYDEYPDILIPESEHISDFIIYIDGEYGNQLIEKTVVEVEDPTLLNVTARGSSDFQIANEIPSSFFLFYTCMGDGITSIRVKMSLGFFGVLEFGFDKDCTVDSKLLGHSNNTAGVINVGVSKNEYANIVENSYTFLPWNAEDPQTVIGTDELLSTFYVSTLSGKEQQILRPIVTVYPSTALTVTVTGVLRTGGVVSGKPQSFVVNYICERTTEANVIVSIKLPGFDTVEFGYTKKCVKLIRHTDNIWTANQILFTLLAFIGFSLIVAIYLLKKRKDNLQSQAVPKQNYRA